MPDIAKNELLEAISERGDELETLKALRKKVANTIDNCRSARDIASLSRQLQQIVTRIKEIELEGANDDEILSELIGKNQSKRVRTVRRKPAEAEDLETEY